MSSEEYKNYGSEESNERRQYDTFKVNSSVEVYFEVILVTKERKSFKITTFFAKLLTDDSLLLSCSKNRIPLTAGGLCRLKCEKKKKFFRGEERGASPLLDKSLLFRHFLSLTVLRHATPKLNIVV